MIPAHTYRIHLATPEDADALTRLSAKSSQEPLAGRVLIGEIAGEPAAALSIDDGHVIADRSRRPGRLVAAMRMHAGAIHAYEATPSLRERLLAALPPAYRDDSIAEPVPLPRHAGHAVEKKAA
jgi:hypothetical protein